jgi:hypothetical protein
MIPRWWRVAVWFEDPDGDLFTQTFHLRAVTERKARSLVHAALEGRDHSVYVCHPSDPMNKASHEELISVSYGPYRRDRCDPAFRRLLG